MKIESHLIGIHVLLVISVFVGGLVPLRVQAAIAVPNAAAQTATQTPTPTDVPTATPTATSTPTATPTTTSTPAPWTTTNTEHFSIEWCSDSTDPHYPTGSNSSGFDYIRIISDTLELAWDTYSTMGFVMPPPTPGRSDSLITVRVQANPFWVAGFPMYQTGLSFGGRIWLRNDHSDDFLAHLAAHEFFHLVQYNYLDYVLDVPLAPWFLANFRKIAHRDLWLLESGAQWASPHVLPNLSHLSEGDGLIGLFYNSSVVFWICLPRHIALKRFNMGQNGRIRQFSRSISPILTVFAHFSLG